MVAELTVAVDLDDVTIDFVPHIARCIWTEFAVKIDATKWDSVETDMDWRAFGYKSWWEWLKARDWLWALAPAIPGSIGGIQWLRANGHRPELLTAKPSWAEPQVHRWLGRWRPAFERTNIVEVKASKPAMSDADVLVDDRLPNCEAWVASDPTRFAVLYAQPWNEDFVLAPAARIVRAHGWPAVLTTIETLEEL